jgi:threonine dehydrogenase-like Zn-dependent dehydrogenase
LEGCQAEAVRVPQGDFNATLIPEGLTDDQALMLTDAQSTAYYGCLNADIGPGKTVAVVGLGPIGLMAVEAAYVLGASQVFAIDLLPERRARAEALGATVLLPGDAPAFIREATRGLMVDCAVELVGIDATVRLAIDLVGTGGTVSVVGANFNPEFKFPMDSAFFRSITFRIGACPVHSLWPQLVPLVREGRLHPERFISHRSALSDGVAAYQLFDKKADGVLKIVMEP